MNIPKHLSHKPIIAVDHYEDIDSKLKNNTDVRYLSIGKAQYDNTEISLKVWRQANNKWSRQSEELPIHRNIDLSILFIASLLTDVSSNYPTSNLREQIIEKDQVDDIKDYYRKHENQLKPRLQELKKQLDYFLSLK